ncbi:MAG: glycoside hydrolase family 2 protein, partial [Clostridia bacterium]|nr:glycoside hydrolase family 2 protein [Clostridia bacterium]
MRKILQFNKTWNFYKGVADVTAAREEGETLDLPHSWNAVDGQDGGNDYFRGSCLYVKNFSKAELPESEEYYLQIEGANSSADVYLNGDKLAHHDGGYSTWRVKLTAGLKAENELAIVVDNAPNDRVYPQM